MVEINVRDNNVERALRQLKKMMNREGRFLVMREKRYFTKPFEVRKRAKREAERRARKEENRRQSEM